MTRSLWRWLRQSDQLDAFDAALREKVHELRAADDVAAGLRHELEMERARRIGSEALAAERSSQIERLTAELTEARTETSRAWAERLKSLDAVNIRLLEPRVEAPTPDLKKFSEQAEALGQVARGLRNVRTIHHHVDLELMKLARTGGKKPAPAVIVPVEEGA